MCTCACMQRGREEDGRVLGEQIAMQSAFILTALDSFRAEAQSSHCDDGAGGGGGRERERGREVDKMKRDPVKSIEARLSDFSRVSLSLFT